MVETVTAESDLALAQIWHLLGFAGPHVMEAVFSRDAVTVIHITDTILVSKFATSVDYILFV